MDASALSKPGARAEDREHFRRLITRMTSIGCTPIALVGAGQVARRLQPQLNAPAGAIACVIDDDPGRQGRVWADLPVVSFEEAVSRGVRSAIITAEGAGQDALWAGRSRFREHGIYLHTCPARFASKTWDDCLVDRYELDVAAGNGIDLGYVHDYPGRRFEPDAWLLDPLLERVREGMTVCEIGPGSGLWTERVIERAGAYHAVDFSARLLHEVIEHRFASQMGKTGLHHDETARLAGVPDASVDLLFSFHVFVHFKSDLVHQFLRSAARVLRPSGEALLHFAAWNASAVEIWEREFAAAHEGEHSIIYYNHPEWLATSASALGMRCEQVGEARGHGFLARFTMA